MCPDFGGLYGNNRWEDRETPRGLICVGDVFFRYSLSDALSDGIVNDFLVFNVAVHFIEEERLIYDILSRDILISFGKVYSAYPILKKINATLFDVLDFLPRSGERDLNGLDPHTGKASDRVLQ